MSERTITIGWTKHDGPRDQMDYMPYSDTWRPGQPQHEETITVNLPEDWDDFDVAEAVFRVTNTPYPVHADSPNGHLLAAINATGYRGQGAHYSLSIGDTVTVDGKRYGCATSGWEVLLTGRRALAVDRHDSDGKAYIAYFRTDVVTGFLWDGDPEHPVQVTAEMGEAVTETFEVSIAQDQDTVDVLAEFKRQCDEWVEADRG